MFSHPGDEFSRTQHLNGSMMRVVVLNIEGDQKLGTCQHCGSENRDIIVIRLVFINLHFAGRGIGHHNWVELAQKGTISRQRLG